MFKKKDSGIFLCFKLDFNENSMDEDLQVEEGWGDDVDNIDLN